MPIGQTDHRRVESLRTRILMKVCSAGLPRLQLPETIVHGRQRRLVQSEHGDGHLRNALLKHPFQQSMQSEQPIARQVARRPAAQAIGPLLSLDTNHPSATEPSALFWKLDLPRAELIRVVSQDVTNPNGNSAHSIDGPA